MCLSFDLRQNGAPFIVEFSEEADNRLAHGDGRVSLGNVHWLSNDNT